MSLHKQVKTARFQIPTEISTDLNQKPTLTSRSPISYFEQLQNKIQQPALNTKKSKLRFQDILYDHHDELFNQKNTQSLTGQQQAQMKRVKQNENLFADLATTLNERKLTFMNFSFKSSELDEDPHMKPILSGIYNKQKKGSMLVTELWPREQLTDYIQLASLDKSKRVLKRFAHWEWDQTTKSDKFKDISETLKVTMFTRVNENITKKKLEATNGEKLLKRQIRNKWIKDPIDINHDLQNFKKDIHSKKLNGLFGPRLGPLKSRLKDKSVQFKQKHKEIQNIMSSLDQLQKENLQEDKQINKQIHLNMIRAIRQTQNSLQKFIRQREMKNNFKEQNPFES